jgi:antitoxin YefM
MEKTSDSSNHPQQLTETRDETSYLLQSPRNAKRLLAAVAGLNDGDGVERELIE